MEYTVKDNQVVMFLVVATEPMAGMRLPWLKTFSQEEALLKLLEIEHEYGAGSKAKIEEVLINKRTWEFKFKTKPWPLNNE